MTKNKPFRVTKWIGILMILISLAGFYGLKDAERVSRSAWQVAYMFFVFLGGIFNLFDSGGGTCSKFACLSYLDAIILSAYIGKIYRGGIHSDTYLMAFVFLVSALRWWMVLGHNALEGKKQENTKDTENIRQVEIKEKATQKRKSKEELEKDAISILDDVKWNSEEVNKSVTVFDFTYSYTRMIDGLKELVRLNEVECISMTPPPRKDLEEIQEGIELIIDKFIDRAVRNAMVQGEEEVQYILESMKNEAVFWELATPQNRNRIENRLIETQKTIERIEDSIKRSKEAERQNDILNKIGYIGGIDCSDLNPMDVIVALEKRIKSLYLDFKLSAKSSAFGKELFRSFKNNCESSRFPLMAEVRLESLLSEYEPKFNMPNPLYYVDNMTGPEFEQWCANLLEKKRIHRYRSHTRFRRPGR